MIAVAVAAVACEKNTAEVKQYKTAYVDTNKLLEEYTGAKDIDAKYKAKSEEMGKQLQAEVAKFKTDAGNFQRDAQANGQAWAQKKGAELQKREQELTYAQQAMLQQLQQESGVEMDTLIKTMKKFLKDYGKEKGYDYIYGTGEAASILYAKDQYDITEEVIKLLNEQHKSQGKKEETEKPDTESK